MPRCIYCLEDKPRAQFNREHVIQEGFGRFRGALTLKQMVCRVCNQHFGDTIDRELQREGAEGLERYRWGAKSPSEIGHFRYTNLTLRAKDAGDFADARFELRPGNKPDDMVARLIPTVAFAKKDGTGFVEYTESQLKAEEWRQNPEIDWAKGVKAFASGDELDRLIRLLEGQGVRPTLVRRFALPFKHGQEITVQQTFTITDGMSRALAKIAFNYLAHREKPELVLRPAFDVVRRFVRYGEQPQLPPVHTSFDLPFRLPPEQTDRPVVHFVCIAPRYPTHNNLLGLVSLYGFLTHAVMLSEGYPGPWPKPHAHLYNPKDHTVHPWLPGVPFSPRGSPT